MAFRTHQVAEFVGVKTRTVQSMINRGDLKARKHSDGRHWLIEPEDLATFIVWNDKYRERFANYQPRPRYKDSYQILLREVNKKSWKSEPR